MNRSLLFIVALATPACVVDRLDFEAEDAASALEAAPGGQCGTADGSPCGQTTGSGGAGEEQSGGTGGWLVGPGGQCATADVGGAPPFQRGGYGGDLTSMEATLAGIPRGGDPACFTGDVGRSTAGLYDDDPCVAATACLTSCGVDAALGDACEFQLTDGTIPGECRGREDDDDADRFFCALPCSSDCDCPGGSICGDELPYGKICMVRETPHAPECDPAFCLGEGPQHDAWRGRDWVCDINAVCCQGLTCSDGLCVPE